MTAAYGRTSFVSDVGRPGYCQNPHCGHESGLHAINGPCSVCEDRWRRGLLPEGQRCLRYDPVLFFEPEEDG